MERYEAYKDSGVEWIGEIPEGWNVRRISALYDARNEKVSDRDYPPLSVTMQGVVPQLETAAKSQDNDNRKLVKTGDFVINSRSDRRGACGISAFDGSVTLISNVLAPKNEHAMDGRYYSYLFSSEGFADEYYRQGTGIVDDLWSTNWPRMKNILVSFPPFSEQQAIADYLDAKTGKIDGLIADCEREVELLQEYRKSVISEAVTKGLDPTVPMKDSGIKWIGEIPKNWHCANLGKSIKTIQTGPFGSQLHSKDYSDDGEICVVNPANIIDGKIVPSTCNRICRKLANALSQHLMKRNEIIFGRRGEMGRCALIEHDGLFCGTGSIEMELYETVVPKFAVYYLRCDFVKSYLELKSVGTTLQNLNTRILATTPFVIAPIEEQNRIVAYLDTKTAEIDGLITDKQTMADKLREYRKSLISEAVTGKFKVPGA